MDKLPEGLLQIARELSLSSEGIYRPAEFEALARDIAQALHERDKRAAEIAREWTPIAQDNCDIRTSHRLSQVSAAILTYEDQP